LHTLLLPTLLLIGVYQCEVLELVATFPTSPSSSKTKFVCIFYCVFELEGFTGYSYWKVHTYPHLLFYILKILGVYLHEVLDLVLSFSKIPSLLKSESGCESYHVFHEGSFLLVPSSVHPRLGPGRSV
jgi:hypothetical protein